MAQKGDAVNSPSKRDKIGSKLTLTIDWDPERECTCPGCCIVPGGPIVPTCPGAPWPFWCGKVWKFIALVGSISSRKPSKWNVAYGQISSSIPPLVVRKLCSELAMSSYRQRLPSKRTVPPFSTESLQKNTRVSGPPKMPQSEPPKVTVFVPFVHHECPLVGRYFLQPRATSFRMYYDRGDLPIKMDYLIGGFKIAWTVDIDKLDYGLYLPLFFDGLSETQHPYKTYARQGMIPMIQFSHFFHFSDYSRSSRQTNIFPDSLKFAVKLAMLSPDVA
uniref:Uncharacterized protein n=1 Tax=Phlebotomus papatasi TaxID=29031 RepID=A0A1B0DJZ8_PHLPP